MSAARKVCFELVMEPAGAIQAIRVPRASLQLSPCLVPDALAALISRLGVAELCLVDDHCLIFCREWVAANHAAIPRGIRMHLYV